MTQTNNKMEKVQTLTNQLDSLQEQLEATNDPIIAMVMCKKHDELMDLGFEYDNINQELIFIF